MYVTHFATEIYVVDNNAADGNQASKKTTPTTTSIDGEIQF
jgi:hypothetical protein